MNRPKAKLELPADPLFSEPAVDFAASFAQKLDCGEAERDRLKRAVRAALGAVMQNNAGGKSEEPVTLELSESSGKLVVEIVNRGVPLLLNDGRENELNASYFALAFENAEVSIYKVR